MSGEVRRQGLAESGIRSIPRTSRLLPQAQASKAKVIGLANAGGDTINAIKQASDLDDEMRQ